MEPTEEDYRLFFGRNHEYYYEKLEKYLDGTKITFNLAAFFFGINWMLYRKLYRQTILVVIFFGLMVWLIPLAVAYYGLSQEASQNLQLACQFLVLCLIGFFGNYMYLRHAMRKVHAIVNSPDDDEDTVIANLTSSGGVSLAFHIILAVVVAVLLLAS